jgi:hypothetical protein
VKVAQRRRDKRFQARLDVKTRLNGRLVVLPSEEVSFRGMFLNSESPPPVRQLLRIETVLPPDKKPFATHAMVVHVLNKANENGRGPGAGIQFYGMGDERRVWEAYIQFVQGQVAPLVDRRTGEVPAIKEEPPGAAAGSGPVTKAATAQVGTSEQRRFARFPVVLEVRPQNLDDLLRIYTRDVSIGGMFLSTAREVEIDSELRLDVRHPHSEAVFPITAVVKRRSTQPLGIGVEFTGLDDLRRKQFFEFIHAPIPTDDPEGLELVEED